MNFYQPSFFGIFASMIHKFIFLLCYLICMQSNAQQVLLTSTTGKQCTDTELYKGKATVFFFITPECPLCQSYTLTIRNLVTQFSTNGITFIGIIPDNNYSTDDIIAFKQTYALPIELFKDEKLQLVSKYKVTITPEVVVVNNRGTVLYQGRIDNWAYALGKKRRVITEHDLQNSLQLIVSNKPIKISKTKAIGCFIE